MALDLWSQFGNTFGFGGWSLGLGFFGNLIIWILLSIIIVGIIGYIIYRVVIKRVYKHKIYVFGMFGKQPMKKWEDTAREMRIGRAGDYLFYLRKRKKFIPPPVLQMGRNEWWYWERVDGELINIDMEDVDTKQRRMGVHFIDTDMRMQRLGIEKNLSFRLQKQTFWQKYGDKIINAVFYVLVTLMLVILFVQWRKTATAITGAVQIASEVMDKTCGRVADTSVIPEAESGVIPAIALFLLTKFKIWRLKNGRHS